VNWTLAGFKTYAVGLLMIALGLLHDPIDQRMIAEGFGFITLRAGVAKGGIR
jgi:hypothetical protein